MWCGRPVVLVADSSSDSEATTVPGTPAQLASMGRGPCWTEQQRDAVKAGLAEGRRPTQVARDLGLKARQTTKFAQILRAGGNGAPKFKGRGGPLLDIGALATVVRELVAKTPKISITTVQKEAAKSGLVT